MSKDRDIKGAMFRGSQQVTPWRESAQEVCEDLIKLTGTTDFSLLHAVGWHLRLHPESFYTTPKKKS